MLALRPFLLLAPLALALAGWASVSVDTDYDPTADFAALRTWGWLHEDAPAGVDDLTVDLVSPDGDTLLWRGTASAVVGGQRTPEERAERIRSAVAALLERYPPGG